LQRELAQLQSQRQECERIGREVFLMAKPPVNGLSGSHLSSFSFHSWSSDW
jgi:hypothetical protein